VEDGELESRGQSLSVPGPFSGGPAEGPIATTIAVVAHLFGVEDVGLRLLTSQTLPLADTPLRVV